MVGRPKKDSGVFGGPFRRYGNGHKASQASGNGREALPEVREWSVGPPGSPGVVGSGRESLQEVRECSGVPSGGPGVVGRRFQRSMRPSRMSGSGR